MDKILFQPKEGTSGFSDEWRDVVGFEGIYKVSISGEIRSTGAGRTFKKVIKHQDSGRLYKQVNLKGKTRMVHRIVAQAWVPNPDNKPSVNHIDNNPQNNHASNLEWVTPYENTHHEIKTKRKMSYVTEEQAIEVIRLSTTGLMYKEISRQTGVNYHTTLDIIHGRSWGQLQRPVTLFTGKLPENIQSHFKNGWDACERHYKEVLRLVPQPEPEESQDELAGEIVNAIWNLCEDSSHLHCVNYIKEKYLIQRKKQ